MDRKASQRATRSAMYVQIANVLRAQVVSHPDSHHRLPSEQELAKTYRVARGTIQAALNLLTDEGLIVRTPKRRAISNPDGIRMFLKQRQRRAIVVFAYNYRYPEVPEGYYGQIYQGILTAAEQAGYRCILRWLRRAILSRSELPGLEDRKEVMGVIMLAVPDPTVATMHMQAGLPVVSIDHWPLEAGLDGVVVDCFAEAHQAVNFLVGNGHRDLFYAGNMWYGGVPEHAELDAVLMEAGYRHAVHAAGLAASADRVRFCLPYPPEVSQMADWLTSLRPLPSAGLVFDSNAMTYLIDELSRRGIHCPEDISLICKTFQGSGLNVASICADPVGIGSRAVELLIGRATGKVQAGTRLAVESKLVRGPTVRCLPSHDVA